MTSRFVRQVPIVLISSFRAEICRVRREFLIHLTLLTAPFSSLFDASCALVAVKRCGDHLHPPGGSGRERLMYTHARHFTVPSPYCFGRLLKERRGYWRGCRRCRGLGPVRGTHRVEEHLSDGGGPRVLGRRAGVPW